MNTALILDAIKAFNSNIISLNRLVEIIQGVTYADTTPNGDPLCPFKGPNGYEGLCSNRGFNNSKGHCKYCRIASNWDEIYD